MNTFRCVLLALIVAMVPQAGHAQARLEVRRGWGGVERSGRWNPVLVRVSSPIPRDVVIELISPHEGGFATVAHEHAAIGRAVSTFELFAPARYGPWQRSVLVLRDNNTGRTIAEYPPALGQSPPDLADFGPDGIFLGVTGRETQLGQVRQNGLAQTGYMPPHLLPRTSIGYDSLEILMLNAPASNELDADQQRAILDWVRAGGSLLYVPGDETLSSASPLAAVLPCQIGPLTQVDSESEALRNAGLDERSAHLTGHVLSAKAGSMPLDLIPGGSLTAWSGTFGLGRVLVSPIDLAGLQFSGLEQDRKGAEFWRPILARLVHIHKPAPRRKFDAPYYGFQSESEDQQREGAAVGILCDFIGSRRTGAGDLPVSIPVLFAIFFLVGPFDSFLQRLRGRRAITLVTSVGWIGLLGVCGWLGAQSLRPNHVEFAGVRVLDQVGDTTVAVAELASVSSSRGGQFPVVTATDTGNSTRTWWQPAVAGAGSPDGAVSQADSGFHETDLSRVPDPPLLDPDRPRFFRGDTTAAAPPTLAATLSLVAGADGSHPRLVGRVTNVSPNGLKALCLRTRFGVIALPGAGTLPPGQSVAVDLPASGEAFSPQDLETRYQNYGYFGSHAQSQPVDETMLWAVAPDIAGPRSLRIDDLVAGSDYACIYAQTVDPAVNLPDLGTDRQVVRYYQWTRALVTLGH